jgi:CelD/BcsL family acetyltransferase involved in cellulose biosynthesis
MDRLRRRETDRAVNVDVLTSRHVVAALEAEWDSLLESTTCNRAFSSFAWFEAACAEGGSPLVVTARRDGRLVAILPLFVPDGSNEACFATRLADYNDIIAAPGDLSLARDLLRTALETSPSLHLLELREDSLLLTAFDGDVSIEHEPARPAIWTPLAGGWVEWLAERSRAFRKSLFRAERAAAARGLVVRELDDSEVGNGEVFLSLHDVRSRESCFTSEEHRSFVRRAVPRLLAQRRMRAFGILDAGRVVAIDLCVTGADSLCTWNTGFTAEYAEYSPGNLLLALEIRAACREGRAEFDLCRGDEAYKASWASRRRDLLRIRVTR